VPVHLSGPNAALEYEGIVFSGWSWPRKHAEYIYSTTHATPGAKSVDTLPVNLLSSVSSSSPYTIFLSPLQSVTDENLSTLNQGLDNNSRRARLRLRSAATAPLIFSVADLRALFLRRLA